MIVTRCQPNEYCPQLRQKCIQAYQQISVIHKKFFQELIKYQCDKETMIQRIVTLSKAQQTVLLDFCIICEHFSMLELGKFMMKMHLQSMEVIKWLTNHIGQFSQKVNVQPCVRFYERGPSKEKGAKKRGENYYRVKQNSMFLAQGIHYQINKIQRQVQEQKKTQLQQLNNILRNKQLVQRIQPSQNQKILFQAVDVISHHSEVFRKLTKNNKQAFIDNYKDLNIKPYSKIKAQIDQVMKERIQKANQQLIGKLDKYIKTKNIQVAQIKDKKFVEKETQINLTRQIQEKHIIQIKNKNDKIKQLNTNINYERKKSQKLQNLLRDKINYFQQKLSKISTEKSKQKQLQLPKKSNIQLTSINNIHNNQSKQLTKIQQIISKKNIQSKIINANQSIQGLSKRKLKDRKLKQECLYQKSLMRIQFNLQNQFDSQTQTSQQPPLYCERKLQICNQQSIFKYQPRQGVIQLMRKARDYKEDYRKKLSFEFNVVHFDYKQALKIKQRNQSLLTITNMHRKGSLMNDGTRNQININYKQHNENEISYKCIKSLQRSPDFKKIQRKAVKADSLNLKDRFNSKSKFIQSNNNMILCTHPTQQNEDLNKEAVNYQQQQKIRKLFNQDNNKFSNTESERHKFDNNFQIINFNSEVYLKNKDRINEMMINLKKKRKKRQQIPKSQKYQSSYQKNLYNPQIIFKIYQNQENAMMAQLQYGVSVVIFQQNKGLKDRFKDKNGEYIQQISNKIYKHLDKERKDNTRSYKQMVNMIKTPLSYIQGNVNKNTNKSLNKQDIMNFVRFITVLHQKCQQKPCEHFKQFLYHFGML